MPNETYSYAERIVVDEILEKVKEGMVRILRAKRLSKYSNNNDLSIHTWKDEKEDFITQWRIEAFVGFPSQRKLREGDVFYIKDGRKLKKYKKIKKVLPREVAKRLHLLKHWDDSIKISRDEIKAESYKLGVAHISEDPKEIKKLNKLAEDAARKKVGKS